MFDPNNPVFWVMISFVAFMASCSTSAFRP